MRCAAPTRRVPPLAARRHTHRLVAGSSSSSDTPAAIGPISHARYVLQLAARAGIVGGAARPAAAAGAAAAAAATAMASSAAPPPRGAFIVFEGVDRCGKSTQSSKLAAALRERGLAVEAWNFPERKQTVTGAAIDDYLKGRKEQDDAAVHLLFSANRWERRAALLAALAAGTSLVVDRYAHSGVAYSAAKALPHMGADWCRAPDAGLPAPDVVIYLDVPKEVAAARAGFGEERYERAEFQERVRGVFKQLRDPSWVVIDAAQPVDAIHSRVLQEALAVVERCAAGGEPVRRLWDRTPYQGPPAAAATADGGGAAPGEANGGAAAAAAAAATE